MQKNTDGQWEKRWHPLREEWVVYAAHRNSRPWQGAQEALEEDAPSYDPACYLCPGNTRVGGQVNPLYEDVYVFDNDHPVVGLHAPDISHSLHNAVYQKQKAYGVARVVCYNPQHNITMSEMPLSGVQKVFSVWRDQMQEFTGRADIHSVLIFENKGKAVGVSNPHPHGQIYAVDFPFSMVEKHRHATTKHRQATGNNLFAAILQAEIKADTRIIAENQHAIAFIPFFARYAYEVMIFPKKRHASLNTLSDVELCDMAEVFQQTTRRYDGLYGMSFPYVMNFFQAPVHQADSSDYHLHMLLQPPLRQPGLVKFLAGPEIGAGNFMADTMPEAKAAELRAVTIP